MNKKNKMKGVRITFFLNKVNTEIGYNVSNIFILPLKINVKTN